jgi:hypothetical protein
MAPEGPGALVRALRDAPADRMGPPDRSPVVQTTNVSPVTDHFRSLPLRSVISPRERQAWSTRVSGVQAGPPLDDTTGISDMVTRARPSGAYG